MKTTPKELKKKTGKKKKPCHTTWSVCVITRRLAKEKGDLHLDFFCRGSREFRRGLEGQGEEEPRKRVRKRQNSLGKNIGSFHGTHREKRWSREKKRGSGTFGRIHFQKIDRQRGENGSQEINHKKAFLPPDYNKKDGVIRLLS